MADKRIVKVLGFTYAKVYPNPYDENAPKIVEHTVATRGEELDFDELTAYDQQRADRHDVFYTDDEAERLQPDGTLALPEAPAGGDTIVLGEQSSTEDLAEWIREDQPTVEEVVELAGDSPTMAQKLIDAENAATGGDPRTTLVSRLNAIASSQPA